MSRLARSFALFVSLVGLGAWGGNAQAAIITSTATGGLWSATTTWVGGVVPLATDSVVIATTTPNVVTLAANTGVVALTINAGSTLSLGAFRIRPTGATSISGTINLGTNTGSRFAGMVTINAGGIWSNASNVAVNFRGGLTNNGGTFTAGTGIQTFNTTAQAIGGTSPITIPQLAVATVAVTNNGNLTVSTALTGTTGSLINSATGTLNIGGTSAITTLNAATAGNTVNYNGAAAQTVKPTTYSNLTLSGGGVKTMTGVTAIAGDLNITGAATMTGNAAFTAGGALNYSSTGATTLAAPIVIGSYNQTAGTFSAGANAITVSGNWNETGTFNPGTGTVTLNGAAAQIISGTSPVNFNNLTVTNGANPNITLATNVTVTSAIIGAHTLTSTCPTDWTLTSNGGATVEHSCAASVVSINCSVSCAATSAATVSWTVTFSASVSGVTSGNFTLVNSGLGGTPAITLVSGGGATWTVTASTGTGTGTLGLNMVNATGVTPTVINLPFTGQVYSIVGAGVINTYYPGAASVLAGATSITLGAATGAATPIAIGDMLLIMQMQDAAIDSTNTATYGTVSGTPTAGKYEYVLAASNVPTTGGTLTLSCGTLNAYTDANYVAGSSGQKRFQVIRVPVYASYAINAITALAWNGSTGGVLAFDVTGALNLNTATVDVSGTGFRGGASRQLAGGAGVNTDYLTLATVNNNASKGEGIAGTPYYLFTAPSTLTNTAVEGYPNGSHARGAPANGGGGATDLNPVANDQNPGGGGGANGGAGGMGGIGWCPTFNAAAPPFYGCGLNSGGLGGNPVTGLGATRLTLGGAGGGGTTNNGTGTPAAGLASSGAAGGGIIMLRAGSLTGAATFNANGNNGNDTVCNDGGGGGGAGGVVLISAGSGMGGATINVNGGKGGNTLVPPCAVSTPHGPGGGGGGGYAITSGAPAASSAAAGANGVTYNGGALFGAYGATAGSAGSSNTGLTAAAIPGVALGATACTATDHFAINIGGASASTCTPKSITITAQDALNATVTNYTGTVNITTSPAHGDWAKGTPLPGGTLTPGAADSGAASYQFVAGDNGVATLALTNHHADGSQTITVVDSGLPATSRTSLPITFSDNAFVITNDSVQVAGRPQAMGVAMWRKDITTGVCAISPYYTGAKNLKAWLTLDVSDPGGAAPSIGALSLPSALPGADNLPITFSAGSANFNLSTSDVGKYVLNLRDDSGTFAGTPGAPIQINGSSSTITTRPFALVVSAIKQGATNNPANTGPGGAVFAKAGTSFQATVGAYLWNTAADTNIVGGDGIPDAGATLAQITVNGAAPKYNWTTTLSAGVPFTPATPSDTPPGTGTAGSFSNGVQGGGTCIAPNCFTSGIATPTNLSYSEVGSFTLGVAAASFLNTAGVDLTAANGTALVFDNIPARNGVVGRFYPDHFTATASLANRSDLTCSPASTFTYMGEPMLLTLTINAQNTTNGPTKNYEGSFVKLDGATVGKWTAFGSNDSIGLGAVDGTTALSARLGINGTPIGSWAAGTGTLSAGVVLNRAAIVVDGAFENLKLGIAPQDSDGVMLLPGALDLDADLNGSLERKQVASSKARYGKFVLSNASGSERQNLPVAISAMYYAGSPAGWSANTDDGCTALPVAPFTGHGSNTTTDACYTAACTSNTGGGFNSVWLHDVGSTLIAQAAMPNASSGATLTSSGPGAGTGTVTLAAPGFPATPTPGTLQFTLVAPPWLRTNSGTLAGAACTSSASFGCDPMGRITFGVYGPATNKSKYIYIRENY